MAVNIRLKHTSTRASAQPEGKPLPVIPIQSSTIKAPKHTGAERMVFLLKTRNRSAWDITTFGGPLAETSRPHLSMPTPQVWHVQPPQSIWPNDLVQRMRGALVPHRGQESGSRLIPQRLFRIVPHSTASPHNPVITKIMAIASTEAELPIPVTPRAGHRGWRTHRAFFDVRGPSLPGNAMPCQWHLFGAWPTYVFFRPLGNPYWRVINIARHCSAINPLSTEASLSLASHRYGYTP